MLCRSVSISQPLMKCKRVFQALIHTAIEELCETANALVAPVRLGVARPTASFSLVSSNIDAVQVSARNRTFLQLDCLHRTNSCEPVL